MVSEDPIATEAIRFCEDCKDAGGKIRLFGSVAVSIVVDNWLRKHPQFRHRLGDIDFVGRKEDLPLFREIASARGYREAKRVALETEGARALFGKHERIIDFAADELSFCQTLPLRSRLDKSFPTLSPTDLVLEKLQIVEPTLFQLHDFVALVFSFGDQLEQQYLDHILGRNWGYWYSSNLFIEKASHCLREMNLNGAEERMQAARSLILDGPKSLKWNLRRLFGSRLPWYAHVEPLNREARRI